MTSTYSSGGANQGESAASRRVAGYLRRKIDSGELVPGDRLPSERMLAAEHGVARNTAREAVRLLAESGLVTAEHGRGVFVRNKPRVMRFGQSRYSRRLREQTGLSPFHAEVRGQGREPSAQCTSVEEVAPPPDIAHRLGLDPAKATVVRRENWYFADDEPMQVGITFIPVEVAQGSALALSGDRLGKGDLYARFEEQGHLITYTREEVTARMPSPSETSGLRIPAGVPVLEIVHTGFDQNRAPFEVTLFVMRADFMGLDYTMAVDD